MKNKGGRPVGSEYPVTIAVRVTAKQVELLDRLRKIERDMPNRSEMIRRLIEQRTLAEKEPSPLEAVKALNNIFGV